MSTLLSTGVGTVPFDVQPRTGFTSGKPSYGSASGIEGAVRLKDTVVRTGAGEDVMTNLTAWIDAGQDPKPGEGDRITLDSVAYIVVTEDRVTDLQGALDHVKITAREE